MTESSGHATRPSVSVEEADADTAADIACTYARMAIEVLARGDYTSAHDLAHAETYLTDALLWVRSASRKGSREALNDLFLAAALEDEKEGSP